MAADEATVDRIIQETLNRYGGDASQDPDVTSAVRELYNKRNNDPALVGDENYAVAEHYMLSRAMVATAQVPFEQMIAQIEVYNALKKVAQKVPLLELAMRHDIRKPTTPPSELGVRKAWKGALDGERQRVRNRRPRPPCNPKAFTGYSAFQKGLVKLH